MLYLLPSPIGNLADITLRTIQILQECEVFLCEDTRMTQKLLSLLEKNGSLKSLSNQNHPINLQSFTEIPHLLESSQDHCHDLKQEDSKNLCLKRERKFFSFHSHNQAAFLDKITPSFFDVNVAFLSDAGMPCVSDPGSALVQYAQKMGISYEILPGASAPPLAYAYSGFGDGGFVFDGFLPHKSIERQERLAYWKGVLSHSLKPLIVFESPHRLIESLEDLQRVDGRSQVFAIKEMTKKFCAHFCGHPFEILQMLKEQKILGEWVLVIKFTQQNQENKLGVLEVLNADIPPKIKAKLLSKITGQSVKEWYQQLMESER